jgi:O-antigen/teichoic acid export membrane protein
VGFAARLVNLKGELFSSTFTFGLTAAIRLGSSLILTRLLAPEAYGIFGILLSFLFMIELLSDVGTVGLLIRHPRGDERVFVHTIWTVRLIRCSLNFLIVFFGAPLIAAIYNIPLLTGAFRTLSFWFLISGAESMSFAISQRRQKARISNYAELISNAVMTIFVIAAAGILKSHYALIYGSLLQRALLTIGSYFFFRDIGVGFAFDREALVDQFRFARYVLPSSVLSIVLTQYDKVILLKFFNLTLMGIYSIAGNMIGPVSGVITHNARVVLYARCAEYFRSNPDTARSRYYSENGRLLLIGIALPALVAGFARLLIAVLYDARYAMVGDVLTILGLGTIVFAFQNASENLLVAAGKTNAVLMANVIRLSALVPASFLGYYLGGFYGFLWFNLAATFPLVFYFFRQQQKMGLLDLADELKRFAIASGIFAVSYVAGRLLLSAIPAGWLHLGLSRH